MAGLPPQLNDQRFPRAARLLSSAEFQRVFQQNRKLTDRYWTCLYRHNDSHSSRLGMAVAKKRARRATDRNRIKRLIRESFRRSRACSDIAVDIVILPRSACVSASNAELARSLNSLWQRLLKKCDN